MPTVGDWSGVELVVPYSNEQGDEWRERALDHCRRWWAAEVDLQLTTYQAPDRATGRWSKGASIILGAVAQSRADILIVVDADCLPDLPAVDTAIRGARRSGGWYVPHSRVRRLSQVGTEDVYLGADPWGAAADYGHRGMAGGGCVVMRRETLLACPPDPRFVGWGNEDEAWAYALRSIVGACTRLPSDLVHLWHPRAERINAWLGSVESGALRDRYRDARRNGPATRAIIDEYRTEYEL